MSILKFHVRQEIILTKIHEMVIRVCLHRPLDIIHAKPINSISDM